MVASDPAATNTATREATAEILDACCGGRMWWWDKAHPLAVYMDSREFKWGAAKLERVEPHFPSRPIVGTRTPRGGQTRWFIFYKALA